MRKRIISIALVITMIAGLMTVTGCRGKIARKTVALTVLEKVDEELEEIVLSDTFQIADTKERLEIAVETVEQLIIDKLIKKDSVQVLEEEGAVVFEYEGGGTGTIHAGELSEPTDSKLPEVPERPEIEDAVVKQEEQAQESGKDVIEADEQIPTVDDKEGEWSKQPDPVVDAVIAPRPAKLSIRVYNAFEDIASRNNNYDILTASWLNVGLTQDQINVDNEVYVEELLTITDYSMVSFSMHGSVSCDELGNIVPTLLLLDDKATYNRNSELCDYLYKHEVAKVYTSEGLCYSVNPTFFQNNLSDNALSHTIVYSESCEFFGKCMGTVCDRYAGRYCDGIDLSFGAVFYGKNCPAIMGFHNSVWSDYALEGLCIYGATLNMGYTPEYAYGVFVKKRGLTDTINDETGLTAYPILVGKNITCTVADLYAETEQEPVTNPTETAVTEPEEAGEHTMIYIFKVNETLTIQNIYIMSSDMGNAVLDHIEPPFDSDYWMNYAMNKYFLSGENEFKKDITNDWIRENGEYFEHYDFDETGNDFSVKSYPIRSVQLYVSGDSSKGYNISIMCSNTSYQETTETETETEEPTEEPTQEETETGKEDANFMTYVIRGYSQTGEIIDMYAIPYHDSEKIQLVNEVPFDTNYWISYALSKSTSGDDKTWKGIITEDWLYMEEENFTIKDNNVNVGRYFTKGVYLIAKSTDDGIFSIQITIADRTFKSE